MVHRSIKSNLFGLSNLNSLVIPDILLIQHNGLEICVPISPGVQFHNSLLVSDTTDACESPPPTSRVKGSSISLTSKGPLNPVEAIDSCPQPVLGSN